MQLPHTYRGLGNRPGGTDGIPVNYDMVKLKAAELYDLQEDIGEKHDLPAQHPEMVKRLEAFAEKMREELGDSLTGREGKGVREAGGEGNAEWSGTT